MKKLTDEGKVVITAIVVATWMLVTSSIGLSELWIYPMLFLIGYGTILLFVSFIKDVLWMKRRERYYEQRKYWYKHQKNP